MNALWLGMLWYDPDKLVSVSGKILKAAAYYEKKYSRRPDLVFINPGDFAKAGDSLAVDGRTIEPDRYINPNHFWIGWSDGKKSTNPES